MLGENHYYRVGDNLLADNGGKMKAFVSWSGGKEASLSCYRIMQHQDVKIAYLLNMVSEDGKYSRSHRLRPKLLKLQAEAMGIPIVQRKTTWKSYEAVFKKAVRELKMKGVDTGIFGDIDLQEHRDWVEKICKSTGVKPVLPLWQEKREKLLKKFINLGFKAIVIATQASFLDNRWLGRKIDSEFVKDLESISGIDPCGERGEYHTFVYDGPIFKKPIRFAIGKKMFKDEHWFLGLISKS